MGDPASQFESRLAHDAERLSRISTSWSLVAQAHGDSPVAVSEAQRELLQRYCGAAYRYLLGALRDESEAAELFQEFALRFLRGDFHRADPGRGRFRDYLRTALIHLVTDYHRARRNQPQPLVGDLPAVESAAADDDQGFLTPWRDELLARAWSELETMSPALHEVLLCRAENPDATAQEIADRIGRHHGKALTASHVRVQLHRARAQFSQLLLAQVTASLTDPTPDAVENELRVLGLQCFVNA